MEKFNSSRQRFPALTRSRRHAVTSKEGENRLAPTKLFSYLGMSSRKSDELRKNQLILELPRNIVIDGGLKPQRNVCAAAKQQFLVMYISPYIPKSLEIFCG